MDLGMDDYKYIFEENRLGSFSGRWKSLPGFKHCTPHNFAAAGFYYAGSRKTPDNVKCFACHRELNNWERDDDPWEEHKKRGDHCVFVQLSLKSEITARDIMTLLFEMRKKHMTDSFEQKKDLLLENHKMLMKLLKKLKGKK